MISTSEYIIFYSLQILENSFQFMASIFSGISNLHDMTKMQRPQPAKCYDINEGRQIIHLSCICTLLLLDCKISESHKGACSYRTLIGHCPDELFVECQSLFGSPYLREKGLISRNFFTFTQQFLELNIQEGLSICSYAENKYLISDKYICQTGSYYIIQLPKNRSSSRINDRYT